MASPSPAPTSATPTNTGRPYQISPIDLAPDNLWQAINPWSWQFSGDQIGLINISIGETKYPELERKILDEVGSYGRQIGRLGDAMEVLIGLVDKASLTDDQRDTLEVLEGELAKIRKVKRKHFAGE